MRLFELKLTQLAALLYIHQAEEERATCTDLSRALGVSTAAITGMKDRLVGAGLLIEQPDPADRRQTIITLSSKGREACSRYAKMDLSQPFKSLTQFLNSDT